MAPDPDILTRVMDEFSSVEIDGVHMVMAESFPFSPRLRAAREYAGVPIEPWTPVVCFKTVAEDPEHVESFYCRREDLFAGNVRPDGAIIVRGLAGGEYTLRFYLDESPAALV